MNPRWLVVCAVAAFLAFNPPRGGTADKEEKGLQGRWVAEKNVDRGKEAEKDEETTLVIDEKCVSWTYVKKMGNASKESTITFTYKLDSSKKPAEIDLTATEGSLEGKVFPSIYKLNGDTLEICRSQPDQKRPTEFTSKKETDHVLLVLKRVD
jgi:uncharacterized protein (TIGR03067 family)